VSHLQAPGSQQQKGQQQRAAAQGSSKGEVNSKRAAAQGSSNDASHSKRAAAQGSSKGEANCKDGSVGLARTVYMTVILVISLPKVPYIHRIYGSGQPYGSVMSVRFSSYKGLG
jgi:hypothetical protein